MDYKLMAEVLQLAVDKYLHDGMARSSVGKYTWLCSAVGEAIRYKLPRQQQRPFSKELKEIEKDITEGINGKVFATNHLRNIYGWQWPEDKEKIQAWRKQLAESLIAKYKEKAE